MTNPVALPVAFPGPGPGSRVPIACGLSAAAIAAVPFAGWLLDLESLKQPLQAGITMNPTTSIGLLLAACVLLLRRNTGSPARRTLALALAAISALIGLLRLSDIAGWSATGVDLGFASADELVARKARMASTTAFALATLGSGLVLSAHRTRGARGVDQLLILVSGLCALVSLVGYLYGVPALHGPMALNTAVCFLLLAVGALAAEPERGLWAMSGSSGPGRLLVRFLIPALGLILLGLGLLRLVGQQRGWFGAEAGTAYFVVACLVLFSTAIFGVARALDRADRSRVRAEVELGALGERYRTLFELNPLPTWVFDVETLAFLAVNDVAVATYGWRREEFLAMTIAEIRPTEDLPALRAAVASASPESQPGRIWRHRRKDGSLLEVDVVGHSVAFGGRAARLIVVRDVTEERRLTEALRRNAVELEAANQELDAFSYSVSHDLRAPLRSIDGFSKAVIDDYGERLDETGRDFLRRVRASSQRMAMLIDDLLQLSRISRAPLRLQPTDLSAIAGEILDELRRRDPERVVEAIVEPGLVAPADSRLLGIVLRNLLENAWKYTGTRPAARIELGREVRDEADNFFVRDDGVGFDMTYVGKLFAPFQRLHGADQFEGTGIGLATVQRIVHRHGGRVWAEGEVGRGATFRFTLGGEGDAGR